MPIKVVAFEVDDTLWSGQLDKNKWGRGPHARAKIQDNLQIVSERKIRDISNPDNYITLYPDVPDIIHNIVAQGLKLALVSNVSKEMSDRALYYFKALDAANNPKSIISLVSYDEVGKDGKLNPFKRIQEWSGASYDEMIYFDSDSSSKEVEKQLGVRFERVSRSKGIRFDKYQQAIGTGHKSDSARRSKSHSRSDAEDKDDRSNAKHRRSWPSHDPTDAGGHSRGHHSDPCDTPFYHMPSTGRSLGSGKFSTVYEYPEDNRLVVKVLKAWTREQRHRFLDIYAIVNQGKRFDPRDNENDKYLSMLALELRNLALIGQLKAPHPEQFSGWFTTVRAQGTPLWKSPLYQKHPFGSEFKHLVRDAFHLAIDEIEHVVKKYGVEHCDAHLANVYFTMRGDQPVRAHLMDWGIAGLMTYKDGYYVRGNDPFFWDVNGAGQKYDPAEFRRFWIDWMVKTEYEALLRRHAISERDCRAFLRDVSWWYRR